MYLSSLLPNSNPNPTPHFQPLLNTTDKENSSENSRTTHSRTDNDHKERRTDQAGGAMTNANKHKARKQPKKPRGEGHT